MPSTTNMRESLFDVYKNVDIGFEIFSADTIKNNGVFVPYIDYQVLEKELERLVFLVDNDLDIDDKYMSLFVFGPTGCGKTEICQSLAEKHGYHYHKLEIQKIPLEELGGFPYLDDQVEKDGTLKKVTRLAHPTVLPPSEHDGKWILHLDEFNKADAEKMAAVMNLVLTGEIGGAADFDVKTGKSVKYKLPRKTIILGTGNPRTQGVHTTNFNLVHSMDIATAERFHRTLLLEYDCFSWLEAYGNKPFTYKHKNEEYKLFARIAPIINYFIMNKASEEKASTPFEILVHSNKEQEDDNERSLSPRSWTLISDNMLADAILQWKKLSLDTKKWFKEISEKRYGDDSYAFCLFFNQPSKQIELIYQQHPEFGVESSRILKEIMAKYQYYFMNRIKPVDVIYNYPKIREQVKKLTKDKEGLIAANTIVMVAKSLFLVKPKSNDIKDQNGLTETHKIFLNVSTFLEDLKTKPEDLAIFITILQRTPTEKNTTFLDALHKLLLKNQIYSRAWKNYSYNEALVLRKKDEQKEEKNKEEEIKKKVASERKKKAQNGSTK